MLQRVHNIIRVNIKRLQRYASRSWYMPLIALLAALDNLVILIPTDGILISSSMLNPKRWPFFALSISFGSTLGALSLLSLVHLAGLPWILTIYPGLTESQTWIWSLSFFGKYGLLFLFVLGLTPLMQQPAIILAGLSNISFFKISLVIFMSRLIKYLLMAYVASHSPRMLSKFWGLKDELEDANVKLDES